MNEIYKARLGLIPVLAKKHSSGHIGRTALMKYMYFLQTLRSVPLGYNFTLYSYGPFDSDVLSDLSSAEASKIVESSPILFSGGYGYQIRASVNAEKMEERVRPFLAEHARDIDWLFEEFGSLNSADLELTSTIIYVDRELADEHLPCHSSEIVARVKEIKPHFERNEIQQALDSLLRKRLLTCIE